MQSYDVIKLTQELIKFPSLTPAGDDIFDYLQNLLKPLGFDCQMMNFQSNGSQVMNLFARYGAGAPHFCFAGHVDVVPVGDLGNWQYPPYAGEIDSGLLYGRGAVDMKGAIAAFIAAVAKHLEKGALPGSVSLLITGDEEGDAVDGTVKVLQKLKELKQLPDVCLVGEPTSEDWVGDTIKNGRRGSLSGHIQVQGKQGHVAYPQRANNPLPSLIEFLFDLQQQSWDKGSEHFDASNLEITSVSADNIAVNVIPAKAEAKFNIRYNNQHTRADLIKRIESLAQAHCKEYSLEFSGNAEPFLNGSNDLVKLTMDAVESVTSQKPKTSTSGGTSDARFIHHYCPVLELGLLNHTAHQVDEHVGFDDLRTLKGLYGQILNNYFVVKTE